MQNGMQLSKGELLMAGAGAGVVSKTITAPMDRIRILFQVSQKRVFSLRAFFDAGVKIARRDGIAGLWRGNVVVVLRVMPYAGLQFMTFERYRIALQESMSFGQNTALLRFSAGALAGATATTITYPLDLMRAQMAVSGSSISVGPIHTSYASAFQHLIRTEGFLALFSGLRPTLMGIVPNAGMSFMIFESLKPWLQKDVLRLRSERELPLAWRLAAGGVAGFVAQSASYPLHVVRRRMQVSTLLGCSADPVHTQGSVLRTLFHIFRTEGLVNGWYKGGSLTLIKGPMTAACGFAANDFFKSMMSRMHGDSDRLPPPAWPVRPEVEFESPSNRRVRSQPSALDHLISGGAAGAVAKTVIAPADRVKILYQTKDAWAFSWSGVSRTTLTIYRNTGILGLWRGHCATLLRVIPYSATAFMTFDRYRSWISQTLEVHKVTMRFLAGAMAGATATTLTYPLDLMRARMAAHWSLNPMYPNYFTAFQAVIREEGASALFKGIRPTLLGIMPYAGLSFMAYETMKQRLEVQAPAGEVSVGARLASGALAGCFAQTVTYPLDMIRRRMQVHPDLYRNEVHALQLIYTTEGLVRGLFKGVTMNWLKGPVAVGVSFTVNDMLKSRLGAV